MEIREGFKHISRLFRFRRQLTSISLNAIGPVTFEGEVGKIMRGICPVVAQQGRELKRAKNVSVRYQVLEGPLLLGKSKDREVIVRTNERGMASIDGVFEAKGTALVAAEIADLPEIAEFFGGHSEGMTYELNLYVTPTVPAESGVIEVRIIALDHRGDPVPGADLVLEASLPQGGFIEGTLDEVGNGVYQGQLKTQIAGPWTVLVQDRATKVTGEATVVVLPGGPHVIRVVGDPDPRSAPPYGEAGLRIRLEDQFLNALDPHRIECVANGGTVHPVIRAEQALFPIRFSGYGAVDVRVSDRNSDVSWTGTIPFAAAWFGDPGRVLVGSTFTTLVYGLPPVDRPARRATIELSFDPSLVAFRGLRDAPSGGPHLATEARVDGSLLVVEVEAEYEIHAEEYPDGVPVCVVDWECLEEGETCFELIGKMSPSTPGWKKCITQKKKDKKCICINVIYKAGDAKGKGAEAIAETQVESLFDEKDPNVARCCPIIEVKTHDCAISATDWKNKIIPAVGADGQVTSNSEFNALFATGHCQRKNCINMYMIPFNDPAAGGRGNASGQIGLDPSLPGTRANVIAHEVGHCLGLPDLFRRKPDGSFDGGPAGNLMSFPHGASLTTEQCKTIWSHVDKYPC